MAMRRREDPGRVRETVSVGAALQRAVADLGIQGKLEEQRALMAWPGVIEEMMGAGLGEGTEAKSIQRGERGVSGNQDALPLLFGLGKHKGAVDIEVKTLCGDTLHQRVEQPNRTVLLYNIQGVDSECLKCNMVLTTSRC